MAPFATAPAARVAGQGAIAAALGEARERTLELVAPVSDADMDAVHSTLMSPLAWDIGHIAAFEDLWLAHRHGGLPLLRDDLMDTYDAFETPRAGRGALPFLRHAEALSYMHEVRERVLAVLTERGSGDGTVAELVLRHEMQHGETMLQAIELAGLDYAPRRRLPGGAGTRSGPAPTGLETVEVPGGAFPMGAVADGFAYDNERPRHAVELPGFRIGRTPISNATFLSFVEGGGYERREWWSDEGWAWKEEYDITHPGGWAPDGAGGWEERRIDGRAALEPDRPVVHVSWFEADAFARAHGARLPSEAEWEKAATWDHEAGTPRSYPWGEEPPVATRANLDQLAWGTSPADDRPDGASPCGCLGMLGDVWEWTASSFGGYPGFRAHPYREYSEVFFGGEYRVLRGGSWATRARVATPTFRNWDFPRRRQIFAGLRIARDPA
ncbi:MAG: ergothioneine biosynthesis protein EgtB [Solirubrobacteraceae bacterium]